MIKNIIYCSLIVLFLFGCSTKSEKNSAVEEPKTKEEHKLEQESIKDSESTYSTKLEDIDFENTDLYNLNEKAVRYLEQGKYVGKENGKDSLLELSILYSSKIIERDSSFIYAYINKSAAYTEIKNYKGAIEVLKELKNRAPIYPDATFRMGIISEKMGNDSIAQNFYKQAFDEYQEYLISPNATAADDINFEFLYLLLEGKVKALKRLEGKLKSSPNNPTYLTLVKNFQEFNRDEYIKDF